MDDKYKLISEIDGRLQAGKDVLAGHYAALGRYAADKAEVIPDGNIRGQLNQIAECRSAIQNTTRMGKRILEIVERLEEIRKASHHFANENTRLEAENLPAYEEFGRRSSGGSNGTQLPPEAAEMLAAIKELQKKADETDERVSSLKESAREKPFLSRVFEGGKAMFLNSSKTFKIRNLTKLHQNFGKAALEALDEVPAGEYLNIYRANRKKMRDNEAQTESLGKEGAALDTELRELGVEKRFQKRLKDLEIQNDKSSLQLEELLQETGRGIYTKHKDFDSGRAAELVSDIDNCIQRNAEYEEERKRLEAAIQYDNLTRKIYDLREQLENEEKAVITHRTNAENLKNEIEETEKERKTVEKLSQEGGEKRRKNGGNSKTAKH